MAVALADLNTQGLSGALELQVAAGYTESVPAGGFTLSVSGSSLHPLIIKRSGAGPNPRFLAYTGTKTPGSSQQDGLFRLNGCDYVIIDGIDLFDGNDSNPGTMEFGYGLFKNGAADGCQHVTIQNCTVTLSRLNNASGSGPAASGSRCIDMVNATMATHNSSLVISSPTGEHCFNVFMGNRLCESNNAISLQGYNGQMYYDHHNTVGSLTAAGGNTIVNFGGGGTVNASAGITSEYQHDFLISNNKIISNDGYGAGHAVILRGIRNGIAPEANVTISGNTVTLHSEAQSSQLVAIENLAGGGGSTNSVSINNNYIVSCNYQSSVSGPFYGIWNTATAANIHILNNTIADSQSGNSSGSVYLVLNNGAVSSQLVVSGNKFSHRFTGPTGFSGTFYGIANNAAGPGATVQIVGNDLHHVYYRNHSSGNLNIIQSAAAAAWIRIDSNIVRDITLNSTGSFYGIYDNASSSGNFCVSNNVIQNVVRTGAAGNTYGIYSAGTISASAQHTISYNKISGIEALPGTGSFYGIYTASGNNSPFPKKQITDNIVRDCAYMGTGNCYGIYATDMGDGSGATGSSIRSNQIQNLKFGDLLYGLYVTTAGSPAIPCAIESNTIQGLISEGSNSTCGGIYLSGTGAGVRCLRNKVSHILAMGASGTAHGLYCTNSPFTELSNNAVADISAPLAAGNNRVNGIYLNAGSNVQLFYNTVYLNAATTATSQNSNALYAVSAVSLTLRNNILLNNSNPGNGICAAYRRSTSSLANFAANSNNNLFYAGVPSSNHVIFHNGSAYSTLAQYKSFVSPRDAASLTQDLQFISANPSGYYFLHPRYDISQLSESNAATLQAVSDDIEGEPRYGSLGYAGTGTSPDLGCNEYEEQAVPCFAAVAGTLFSSRSEYCGSETITLHVVGSGGGGNSLTWQHAAGTGSFAVVQTGGYEYLASLAPGNHTFLVEASCPATSVVAVSNQVTLTVHGAPHFTSAITTATLCSGDSLHLYASGKNITGYHWQGPDGFYSYEKEPVTFLESLKQAGNYSVTLMGIGDCYTDTLVASIQVGIPTVSIQSSAPGSACPGDSIILQAIANASTFTWSTAQNGNSIVIVPQSSADYSVQVTDSLGCLGSASLYVAVVDPTIAVVHSTICGVQNQATLAAIPYSPAVVKWYGNSSATQSLHTGSTYTLPGSASATLFARAEGQCASSLIPVTLLVAPLPTLNVVAFPPVLCSGKTVTLTVSGASNYSWVALGVGSVVTTPVYETQTYPVVGTTEQGCKSGTVISVTSLSLPLVAIQTSVASVCPGTALTLTATGASSYVWNTAANGETLTVAPAFTQSFAVYGRDSNQCESSATIAIQTRSVPIISIKTSQDTVCPGQLVHLHADGAVSYTWLPQYITGSSATVSPWESSVYNVIGSAVNNCTALGYAFIRVDGCTGISSQTEDDFKIWSGKEGMIYVKCTAVPAHLELYDLSGRKVRQLWLRNTEESAYLGLSPGIYLAHIRTYNSERTSKLIFR